MTVISPPNINTTLAEVDGKREIIPVIINGRPVTYIGHGRQVKVSGKFFEAVCTAAYEAGVSCEVINTDELKAAKATKADKAKEDEK